MAHIINLFTVAILLINLAGIGLFAQQWIRSYHLAKAVAVIGGCLFLFFLEHFIGLGNIAWVWPISTILSGYFIYSRGRIGWEFLAKNEVSFLIIFSIVFLWRYAFPDVDNRAEGLADLAQMSSFMSGVKLPPPDYWLSQYPLDVYYIFQPYASALLGRILGVSVGVAYNLAVCVLISLFGSLVFSVARRFCGIKTAWFITIAATFGGTGASVLAHLVFKWQPAYILGPLWSGIRFIGSYDKQINTPDGGTEFGQWLFPPGTESTQDLPLETPGFLMMLGDNHAPLGGFLILAMTIAAMVSIEREQFSKVLPLVIGTSIALALITNTWVFPLQGLLVLGWWIYNWNNKALLRDSFLGVILGFILITPFLLYFGPQSISAPMKWVDWADHTPIRRFIALFWPLLLLLGITFTQFKVRSLPFVIAVVAVLILLASEFGYIDDRGGGVYTRFNTTLKWWSWLQVLIVVGLIPRIMSLQSIWIKTMGIIVLCVFTTFTVDLVRHLSLAPWISVGKLQGNYWVIKGNEQKEALLNFLKDAPKGITLEYPYQAAYSTATAISLFADKPSFIGWPGHESLWRNNAWFINNRAMEAMQFYEGKMTNANDWLKKNNIKYVIWDAKSNPKIEPNFNGINAQIIGDYQWQWFDAATPMGVWVRR